MYLEVKLLPRLASNSLLADAIKAGFVKASTITPARTLDAAFIPFMPMDIPPAATACQLCAEVPGTHVAVDSPAVGTTQLTSATSVEPWFSSDQLLKSSIEAVDSKGGGLERVVCIFFPNSFSSAVRTKPPTDFKFSFIAMASDLLPNISYTPLIISYSMRVSVPNAAPLALFTKRSHMALTSVRLGWRM